MRSTQKLLILVAIVAVLGIALFVGQLGGGSDGLQAAFDHEFLTRPDGYSGLTEAYGFEFAGAPYQMEPGMMYKAVADGAVDVICGFATDGRIPAYGLRVLEDDRNFFPPYYAAPLVRRDTLEAHEGLRQALNTLGGRIDDATMQRLNFEVDEKGRPARQVALKYLLDEGILDAEPSPGPGATIAIGGKNFTEQDILAELMGLLIEGKTALQADVRSNLQGTMICFNALKSGDLDLYVEYTGTGLVNIIDAPVINDPDQAYEKVQREFAERWDLDWLEPLGFNNTYTLTMREAQAEELGIESISDLAAYVSAD